MAKRKKIEVQNITINWQQHAQRDYICLTDMARSLPRPDMVISNWLRSRNTLRFLAAWERLYNPSFKSIEFDGLMEHAGENAFTLSPTEWVKRTDAKGIFVKMGRYGGTFGDKLIAFEFGSFISAEFKLLLISEFDRLKSEEAANNQIEWSVQRFLTKRNYKLQTEAVKQNLLPQSTFKQFNWEFIIEISSCSLKDCLIKF